MFLALRLALQAFRFLSAGAAPSNVVTLADGTPVVTDTGAYVIVG
jgi:hypothetical protein